MIAIAILALFACVAAVSAVRVGAKPNNCDVCQAVAYAAHM
jgi:hypothetical protein